MHQLRAVQTAEDWQAMHDIRRATLFTPGRHSDEIVYDENHPDDRKPDNQCFLLMLGGRAIGVARLDRRGADAGVVRLVAISPALQGQGHGRTLGQLIDDQARERGMSKLMINAHERAVGFYQRTGWSVEAWDPSELVGIATSCVQMVKRL